MKINANFIRKYKHYSNRTIKNLIQNIVLSCYGISKFAPKDILKVQKNIKSKADTSIEISESKTGSYSINIYVILTYGLKVSEVLSEVQKRVMYELKKAYGIKITSLNVYAQGIDGK